MIIKTYKGLLTINLAVYSKGLYLPEENVKPLHVVSHCVNVAYEDDYDCDNWDDEKETMKTLNTVFDDGDFVFLDGWNTGSYLILNKTDNEHYITEWVKL